MLDGNAPLDESFMISVSRVLMFGFDGLRPDLISTASMPCLARFIREGASYANARSVFPSETRVAIPSLATGCRPGTHGLVANSLYDRIAAPQRVLNTKYARDIDRLTVAHGRLLAVPSLGARLAQHNRRLDVVWTGTLGAGRAMFPEAESFGGFRWHPEETSKAAQGLEARFRPVPAAAVPAVERVRYGARIFLEHVLGERRPEVAIFWSSEPDVSYHYRGVGSDEALMAMGEADRAFGELLAWRDRQPDREAIVIMALSDHGHITGEQRIDLEATIGAGGFSVGRNFDGGAQFAIGGGGAPGLWQREPDLDEVRRLASWLNGQSWVSLVLSRHEGIARTIPLAMLGAQHQRSPDLAFTFAGSEGPDDRGLPGRGLIEAADVPLGGGMHGGLHYRELANVIALAGGPVLGGRRLETPADITDVAPTVLHLLGLPTDGMDGRPLASAWTEMADQAPARSIIRHGKTALSMFDLGGGVQRPDRLLLD